MIRRIFLSSCLCALAFAALPGSASAIQISRNNPYRSFSISGMNYAAVQWELQQRRKGVVPGSNRTAPASSGYFRRVRR